MLSLGLEKIVLVWAGYWAGLPVQVHVFQQTSMGSLLIELAKLQFSTTLLWVHRASWDLLRDLMQMIGAANFFYNIFLRLYFEKINSVEYRFGLDRFFAQFSFSKLGVKSIKPLPISH